MLLLVFMWAEMSLLVVLFIPLFLWDSLEHSLSDNTDSPSLLHMHPVKTFPERSITQPGLSTDLTYELLL